jgi:putative PIN family toxin of toxin-antitoxin system
LTISDALGGLIKAVLDTNVLVSALVYGGNPEQILILATQKRFLVVTSPPLISELCEILTKKFEFSEDKVKLVRKKVEKISKLVYPNETLQVLKDEPDNRVLEAAVQGACDFVVTGDMGLLELKAFRGIEIVPPVEFLDELRGFEVS